MFIVTNGVVAAFKIDDKKLPEDIVIDDEEDIATRELNATSGYGDEKSGECGLPPSMTLSIFFGCDSKWQRKFKRQSIARVRQVLNLAQNIFLWKSLTTKIRLKAIGIKKYHAKLSINLQAM